MNNKNLYTLRSIVPTVTSVWVYRIISSCSKASKDICDNSMVYGVKIYMYIYMTEVRIYLYIHGLPFLLPTPSSPFSHSNDQEISLIQTLHSILLGRGTSYPILTQR